MNQRLDQPTPPSSGGRNGSQPKEIKNAAKKAKPAASVATVKADAKTENKSTEVQAKTTTAARLSAEERLRLTQQKAYLRAEQRGFAGGDAVADWLAAEAEVNSRFPQ